MPRSNLALLVDELTSDDEISYEFDREPAQLEGPDSGTFLRRRADGAALMALTGAESDAFLTELPPPDALDSPVGVLNGASGILVASALGTLAWVGIFAAIAWLV